MVMLRLMPKTDQPQTTSQPAKKVELYIAGDTLHSRCALENLKVISDKLGVPLEVTVFDVLKDPKSAFQQGIFATPSLIVIEEGKRSLIIGDLSDHQSVLKRLMSE